MIDQDPIIADIRQDELTKFFSDFQRVKEELQKLRTEIQVRYGVDASNLTEIKKSLGTIERFLAKVLERKRPTEYDIATPQDSNLTQGNNKQEDDMGIEPTDQEDAIRRLTAIAEYFERTHPKNPAQYAVRQAIRWADVPLHEWLKDLVQDKNLLLGIQKSLGLSEQDHQK